MSETTTHESEPTTGTSNAAEAGSPEAIGRQSGASTIDLILRKKPSWRPYALAIAAFSVIIGAALMALVWWQVVPWIWKAWLVAPLTESNMPWVERFKVIAGIISIFFVPTLSVWLPGLPIAWVGRIARLYTEGEEVEVARKLKEISQDHFEAEKELEQSDPVGLVPLVRYSRMQLEAYYTIGLNQTRRSFRYSVIAMWLGFAVILSGLIYQVLPLEQMFNIGRVTDIKIVALAGGTVVEIIAALFLWVYRSSIQQLTYYYDRQMHIHDIIFCYRMASSTKDPDSMIRSIVEEVLKHAWKTDLPAPPSGKVLGELFSKQ